MHEFERVFKDEKYNGLPSMAGFVKGVATALKPTREAGRRGGESTARRGGYYFIFSVPVRAHTASG
ncbi:hypothetical protein C9415_27870 [Kluyvera sp. Nf5]|nr:hypothetical protein C9415_27870 [Kluyvera sp. Nf5]